MQKPNESSTPLEPPPAVKPVPVPAPRPEGEIGGSGKPEPTRYGDWEIGGKCVDF